MYVIPSITVVIVFSVLSFCHIKRHIIDNGDVVRNVVIIMITICVFSVVLRFLPVFKQLLMFFSIDVPNGFNFVLNYSIELNYPLFYDLNHFCSQDYNEIPSEAHQVFKPQETLW